MGKKDKKEEQKPKKNNLKAFLKKRAPLYLAGIALIVISANGVLSEKHLDNFLIDLCSILVNSCKVWCFNSLFQ